MIKSPTFGAFSLYIEYWFVDFFMFSFTIQAVRRDFYEQRTFSKRTNKEI